MLNTGLKNDPWHHSNCPERLLWCSLWISSTNCYLGKISVPLLKFKVCITKCKQNVNLQQKVCITKCKQNVNLQRTLCMCNPSFNSESLYISYSVLHLFFLQTRESEAAWHWRHWVLTTSTHSQNPVCVRSITMHPSACCRRWHTFTGWFYYRDHARVVKLVVAVIANQLLALTSAVTLWGTWIMPDTSLEHLAGSFDLSPHSHVYTQYTCIQTPVSTATGSRRGHSCVSTSLARAALSWERTAAVSQERHSIVRMQYLARLLSHDSRYHCNKHLKTCLQV